MQRKLLAIAVLLATISGVTASHASGLSTRPAIEGRGAVRLAGAAGSCGQTTAAGLTSPQLNPALAPAHRSGLALSR